MGDHHSKFTLYTGAQAKTAATEAAPAKGGKQQQPPKEQKEQ